MTQNDIAILYSRMNFINILKRLGLANRKQVMLSEFDFREARIKEFEKRIDLAAALRYITTP